MAQWLDKRLLEIGRLALGVEIQVRPGAGQPCADNAAGGNAGNGIDAGQQTQVVELAQGADMKQRSAIAAAGQT